MSTVFGGSKSSGTSQSGNTNNGLLTSALSPALSSVSSGVNALGNLLGLNGAGNQNAGFNQYKDSAGYKFTMDSGSRAITDNNAANGMLRSGATLKSLTRYGEGVGQQYLADYMKNLLGMATVGTQAAGVLSDSGKYSNSTQNSSSKNGMGSFLGALAASDFRLKEDIKEEGKTPSGINLFSWKYKNGKNRFLGVIAQDLLGTVYQKFVSKGKDGYYRVNYAGLGFIPENFNQMVREGEEAVDVVS